MTELVTKTDLMTVKADLIGGEAGDSTFIENLGLRLTVRLGAMLAAGIAILAANQKLS